MNKRFVIINTLVIFITGFLVHGLYEWFPSVITSIFPVNESLYEHVKLIFMSPIIGNSLLYFIFKYKKIKINNFLSGLFFSTVFNIIIYYLVYIPIYKMIGANMLFTLSWYFVSIVISQFLNYWIIKKSNNHKLNILSLVLIIVSMIVLTYFTYHPLKIEFFRDPENNTYGIK